MTDKRYLTFKFGDEVTYGSGTATPAPSTPSNVYVIREKDYYIIKWTEEPTLPSGVTLLPVAYIIQRSSSLNKRNPETIAVLETRDFNGDLDTCYVDTNIVVTNEYFYSVMALSSGNVLSVASPWVTDFHQNKENRYYGTDIYTSQKTRSFYNILDTLELLDVFDAEANVLPKKSIYKMIDGVNQERSEYLYCCRLFDTASFTITRTGSVATVTQANHGLRVNDLIIVSGADQTDYNGSYSVTGVTSNTYTYTLTGTPASPATGTIAIAKRYVLEVYVDGLSAARNYYYSTNGYFYAVINSLPESKNIRVELCTPARVFLYKSRDYKTYNYLIYTTALASTVNDLKINVESLRADLLKAEVTDLKAFDNFGSFFNYRKPRWMTAAQYLTIISGSSALVTEESVTATTAGIDYLANSDLVIDVFHTITIDDGTDTVYTYYSDFTVNKYNGFITWLGNKRPTASSTYLVSYSYLTTPGLINCGLYGGTLRGIIGVIKSITGTDPTVMFYRTQKGWMVRNTKADTISKMCIFDMASPLLDLIEHKSLYPGYWGGTNVWGSVVDAEIPGDLLWGAELDIDKPIAWSQTYKNFTMRLYVPDSSRDIINEPVTATDTGTGTDYLQGTDLVIGDGTHTVTISGYTLDTDFTVDVTEGSITWISGTHPVVGETYLVSYTISYKTMITELIKQIKFPQMNIVYKWA